LWTIEESDILRTIKKNDFVLDEEKASVEDDKSSGAPVKY